MHVSLEWHGGMRFANSPGSPAIELHSSTPGVTSPPQALAYAVMACMAMDVVHVVEKGRHVLEALTVSCDATRAADPPRRFVSLILRFDVTGDVEPRVVERAIELSRTKYCSVWNTIRPDVELSTTCVVHRPRGAGSERPAS